ncbi:glycoside hydrolase family 43 protein [Schaalia sp. ZJ1691]|uniref:glycoside hydrolase family 43 protein n=1 Tax=Schaalia sp. ZJ1691 TaxID=2709404 RepID=UPI0013ECFE79|nr:glycoside hydrolase family 43 protein [Schaalia sp. ZJ1691]
MTVRNPLLPGMYPDPSVCQVGDVTYLVNSTFTWLPGLPIHASRDLESWELVGHALVDEATLDFASAKDSEGIFAPTLRHIGGRFVLVCTMVTGPVSRSFIMTAPEASGPWSTPKILDGAGGIDPDVFEDADGTVWWTGTRLAHTPLWEQQTEIWTRPVDLDNAVFTGPETVIWHGAVEGAVWSEGPHLYRVGDWYYLLTAEGGTAEEHSVSIARSREVTGPWHGCKRNPIFTHRNLGRRLEVHNVGHADLFCRPDGSWWAVMLGVRLRDNRHLLGRETFLCPVTWEDGWPVFAPGVGHLPEFIDTTAGLPGETRSLTSASAGVIRQERPGIITDTDIAEFRASALRPAGRDWDEDEAATFRGVRVASWDASISIAWEALTRGNITALGMIQDSDNWIRLRLGDEPKEVLVELRRAGQMERVSLGQQLRGTGDHATRSEEGAASSSSMGIAEKHRLWIRLNDLRILVGIGEKDGDGHSYSVDAAWLSTEEAGGFTGCLVGTWGGEQTPAGAGTIRLSGVN